MTTTLPIDDMIDTDRGRISREIFVAPEFHREELEKLLRRDCRQVSSRFISYWEDVAPDGLFLAWLAVK